MQQAAVMMYRLTPLHVQHLRYQGSQCNMMDSNACQQSILNEGLKRCRLHVGMDCQGYLEIKLPGFKGMPAGDNIGDSCIVHKLLLQQRPALDLQIHGLKSQ